MEAAFTGNSDSGRMQGAYFDRGQAFRLQVEISSDCTADCSYCYVKSCSENQLTSKEIKSLLTQAAKMGIKQVDWMGGDPLERPDWIELMQFARYQGMTNNLWTQGEKLNDIANAKHVTDLTKGGYVSIHLDSLDPEILKQLRDSYNHRTISRTLGGLETMLTVGKPSNQMCNLIMLTSVHTLQDVEQTVTTLLSGFGVRSCLMSLKPTRPGKGLTKLVPSPELVRDAYRLRDLLLLGSTGMGCQDFPKQLCGSTVFVSLQGEVSPCYSFRRSVGSIRDRSLSDLVQSNSSSLLFNDLRENKDRGSDCPQGKGSDLCWGCRANAFYFGEGAYARDPLCDRLASRSNVPY